MTQRASIIMPAYGGGPAFARALAAIAPAIDSGHEIIIVDDATPGGLRNALPPGARLIVRERNGGPGAARNDGVAAATHPTVIFIDADVEVRPDTIERIAEKMAGPSAPAALFGSYDDDPSERTLVSRFRNLLHHWVHQHGNHEASTFWAGCGAIKTDVFRQVNGFDIETFKQPSVEDIDLGYRLRELGLRIELDPTILVKHLKKWTLIETIRVDVFRRAIPWTRLMAAQPAMTSDLNVRGSQRISGGLASLALAFALALPWSIALGVSYSVVAIAAGLALVGVALCNLGFLGFLASRGGAPLLTVGFLLYVLYFVYSTIAFVVAKIGLATGVLSPIGSTRT